MKSQLVHSRTHTPHAMRGLISSCAVALILSTSAANAYDQNYMSIGLGAQGDVMKSDKIATSLDWRGKSFAPSMIGVSNISPIAGATVDYDGDLYGFAGLLYDWNIKGGKWHIVPSLAAGLYHKGGDGIDLGGVLEFRYGAEINYALTPESQVGLGFYQLSNFGIYDENPATENIMANYSFTY